MLYYNKYSIQIQLLNTSHIVDVQWLNMGTFPFSNHVKMNTETRSRNPNYNDKIAQNPTRASSLIVIITDINSEYKI